MLIALATLGGQAVSRMQFGKGVLRLAAVSHDVHVSFVAASWYE